MEVAISERYALTIQQAADYFGIGQKKLRAIIDRNPYADFVLNNGNRVLIKRQLFERFLDHSNSI